MGSWDREAARVRGAPGMPRTAMESGSSRPLGVETSSQASPRLGHACQALWHWDKHALSELERQLNLLTLGNKDQTSQVVGPGSSCPILVSV